MPSVRYQSMVLSSSSMTCGPVMGAVTAGVTGAAAVAGVVAEVAGAVAEVAGVAADVAWVAGDAGDAAWAAAVAGACAAGAAAGLPADGAARATGALSTRNSAGVSPESK